MLERVGDEHRALRVLVSAQHDEVSDGIAAQVVVLTGLGQLAHRAVQVGGGEAGEDRELALERRAQRG